MTDARPDGRRVIEPFDPARHDRKGFSSGVAQVDNFLHKTAGKLARAGNVRVHVLANSDQAIIGFHAINAHAIHYAELPRKFARDRPRHGAIPAAFISMIGVDARFQGRGFGGDLLVDCLRRLAVASKTIGIRIVMLDVLDDGEPALVERRRLYAGYGFEPLQSDPLRMFLPIADVEALIGQID